MRCTSLLLFLVGCIDTYAGDVQVADPGHPLGEGLTFHYAVTQQSCESGYDSDGCSNVTPTRLSATIGAGSAVELGRIDLDGFNATGVAPGTSRVDLVGDDDITASLPITVMPVDTTTLFADRDPGTGVALPPVMGAALQVFASSHLTIGQTSTAADHTLLAGAVPLSLAKGATTMAFLADCHCYDTGGTVGIAQLSAPHGTIEVDVVDASAIYDIQLDRSDSITLELGAGGAPLQTFLTPRDAQLREIVGPGPKPTLTIDDPTIAAASFDDTITIGRALFVRGLKAGTTELRITWGSVEKDLVVTVVN